MMNDYRGILALLSGLAGFVLLVVAVWLVLSKTTEPSRRKRVTPVVMYGALFLVAGLLLWSRRDAMSIAPEHLRVDKAIPTAPASAPITVMVDTSTTAPVGEPKPTEPPAQNPPLAEQTAAVDSIRHHHEIRSDRPIATLASESPHVNERGIEFPTIVFESGSADLTNGSKDALHMLAIELKRRPELKIEIQAYVDSFGPGANNFALTQTRASTIRDFLVVKGVAASRLIAQGFGSPSSSNSPIAFVVRR
jgi:outer membrane protein OmpA-like peptidoglycan-associated protein